jgi:O-antigen/teichoic acid export membrane protein
MQPTDRTLESSTRLQTPASSLAETIVTVSSQSLPRASQIGFNGLSLRKNIAWAFASNVLFAACQWGSLVVLAKLEDAATVGRFALALAITGPIFMLTSLQLRGIQATDATDTYQFGHYFALRIAGAVAGLLALLPVIFWSGYPLAVAAVILTVGVGKAFDALNDTVCGLVQRSERLDRVAYGRTIAGVGSLAGLAAMAGMTGDLVWTSLGWAAGHGLSLALAPVWIGTVSVKSDTKGSATKRVRWAELSPIWDFPVLWRLMWLALPMGIVMMLVSLYLNMPRYFIEDQLGPGELGIYAALAYLMVAGHMVMLAVGQAVTPRFAKRFAAGELRQSLMLLLGMTLLAAGFGLLGILIAFFCGDWVLALLYTKEYAGQGWLLVTLAAVAAIQFISSPLGEAMTAMRRFRSQVPLLLAVIGSTALAATCLVPRYGLIGAALASGVGAIVQLLGCLGIIAWTYRLKVRGEL